MNEAKAHTIAQQPTAQELDSASLDLVVGGGVIIHEATDADANGRKQEQSEKLNCEHDGKAR